MIVVGKSLEADIRNKILDYMARAFNNRQGSLQLSYETFGYFYHFLL